MNKKDIELILSTDTHHWIDKAYSLALAEEYSFVNRWTPEQWLTITKAWAMCDWTFEPSTWEPEQINDVLIRGLVPAFVEDPDGPTGGYERIRWAARDNCSPDEPKLRLDGSAVWGV